MATTTAKSKKAKAEDDLFAVATPKKPASKKAEHPVILVSDEEFPGIGDAIQRYNELKEEIKDKEGSLKDVDYDVRNTGKEVFLRLFEKHGVTTGSFILEGISTGAKIMVLPQDRQVKLEEDQYELVKSKYGDDFVEKKEIYSFDPAMLEKHRETISALIMGCTKIPREDKVKLLDKNVTFLTAKGAIGKLATKGKNKIREIFASIEPVFQLKNTGDQ